jgi:cytochrome c5
MAIQLSVTVRNARLDAIESSVGTAPILRIYDLTAGAPANCAAAITATLLAEMTLPSDWMAAASNGAKALAGSWADSSANAAGTADFFRVFESTGTTCHIQGTVTATGAGGDMTLDNTSIASGQAVSITSFTLTDGNA